MTIEIARSENYAEIFTLQGAAFVDEAWLYGSLDIQGRKWTLRALTQFEIARCSFVVHADISFTTFLSGQSTAELAKPGD